VRAPPTGDALCRGTELHRRRQRLMVMERMSRPGFVSGLVAGGVVVGLAWLGASGVFNTASTAHLRAGYSDVASIHLQPVPEGPASPMFVPEPKSVGDKPLALVRNLVPDPLPKPLDQPGSCDHGGDLIVVLKDGREIIYGPCDYPWQISQLWGAMIEVTGTTGPGARAGTPAGLAALEQVRQSLRAALQGHPMGTASSPPARSPALASMAGGMRHRPGTFAPPRCTQSPASRESSTCPSALCLWLGISGTRWHPPETPVMDSVSVRQCACRTVESGIEHRSCPNVGETSPALWAFCRPASETRSRTYPACWSGTLRPRAAS
jgi:hypothetical protein